MAQFEIIPDIIAKEERNCLYLDYLVFTDRNPFQIGKVQLKYTGWNSWKEYLGSL